MFGKYLDERFARVEDRISALEALFKQRADAGDQALTVAKAGLNEMRGMAMDQQSTFLPRGEYEAKHQGLLTMMVNLEKLVSAMGGTEKGGDRTWNAAGIILTLLIALAALGVSVLALHR